MIRPRITLSGAMICVAWSVIGAPQLHAQSTATAVQDEVVVTGAPEEPAPATTPVAAATAGTADAVPAIAGVSGRLAVNLASGIGNQQINGAVIAMGETALASGVAAQMMLGTDDSDRATRIALEGDAFSRVSGMASINITAGAHNQSANLAVLSLGNQEALSDQLLSQSRASIEPSGSTGGTGDRNDTIEIGGNTFRDNSGLIQVNLIGGERNSSANVFVLSVLDEEIP
ncbi:hypothetical protein NT2_09_00280 [Caenibius tardaugens NBRC 16725]|uniref:Uncharacterized protein n=1 Tax=Caenibius tardaugens NBRC 16725 TaxID=1219035 RepID=U2YNK6_9SPHN|nr:hypothetical protein [Caenibius tardaugens]AZI35482.1 hypothetical protein EGO55_05490 [Caenibius tardaugens NBRC 16725]GAD50420.1 hypothetical protein NT2_09_00280 [Caenibius tardaugens NBRC 16725]